MTLRHVQFLTSSIGRLNTAAQAAYMELLAYMPGHRRHTIEGQAILCSLRDAIAECTGNEGEAIQNIFEDKARQLAERYPAPDRPSAMALIEALRPFAMMDFAHFNNRADDWVLFGSQGTVFTMGDWRRARALVQR